MVMTTPIAFAMNLNFFCASFPTSIELFLSYSFRSTPIGLSCCPPLAYFFFRWHGSPFTKHLTWSLNPRAFSSWLAYSNFLAILFQSFAMSTRFCSLTFTTIRFNKCGVSPILHCPMHFSCHKHHLLYCFVTFTLYGHNPLSWHSSPSFSWVLLKPHCYVLWFDFIFHWNSTLAFLEIRFDVGGEPSTSCA
jgi:hypothetical protein